MAAAEGGTLNTRIQRLVDAALGIVAGTVAQLLIAVPVSYGEAVQLALDSVGGVLVLLVETIGGAAGRLFAAATAASGQQAGEFGILAFAVVVLVVGVSLWIAQAGVRQLVE